MGRYNLVNQMIPLYFPLLFLICINTLTIVNYSITVKILGLNQIFQEERQLNVINNQITTCLKNIKILTMLECTGAGVQ